MAGVEHFSRYTCGRCGAQSTRTYREQPDNWQRVTVYFPMLSNEVTGEIYLCEDCVEVFNEFREGRGGTFKVTAHRVDPDDIHYTRRVVDRPQA